MLGMQFFHEINNSIKVAKAMPPLDRCRNPTLKAAYLAAYGRSTSKTSFKKELAKEGIRLTKQGFDSCPIVQQLISGLNNVT